ncbi:hypothetical protein JVT61DRAFT_2437 [Boletus reticuloceps]|uniref:Uncharacterized protein n=1 Tax=Boletus reticuloceps TaxID=495285 RepID=A0A8I2YNY1_9AGAM|nr:hypothetical protein JVT61DRAFT_2437 [Boletus reticuloceps]
MSASPQQEDPADRYDEDIEENDRPAAEEVEGEPWSPALLSTRLLPYSPFFHNLSVASLAATAPKDALPAKRGRGRPKGSKNKKSGATSATAGPSEGAPVKKKRGRPPKEKKPDDSGAEEPPAKRRRGRPRKEQKSQQTITAGAVCYRHR